MTVLVGIHNFTRLKAGLLEAIANYENASDSRRFFFLHFPSSPAHLRAVGFIAAELQKISVDTDEGKRQLATLFSALVASKLFSESGRLQDQIMKSLSCVARSEYYILQNDMYPSGLVSSRIAAGMRDHPVFFNLGETACQVRHTESYSSTNSDGLNEYHSASVTIFFSESGHLKWLHTIFNLKIIM